MGLCASFGPTPSSPEEQQKLKHLQDADAALSKKAKQDQKQDEQVKRLLLLGAGESGKSTVFKQMIKLFGKGFSDFDRLNFKGPLIENIIDGAQRLIVAAQTENLQLQANSEASAQYILDNYKTMRALDVEAVDHFATIWADPAIRTVFERRAKYQVFDSCSYFLDKIQVIAEDKYLPSDEDLLRVRVRTTGMIQEEFVINGLKLRMMDVGGQRNERRKWIHCFEDVTAIVFVAALSEYDQKCFEDEKTNRIIESLSVFEETVNLKWFRDSSVILFLNKNDLFEDKFQKVPLSDYFPSFQGSTPEEAVKFFADLYRSKTQIVIYPHTTTATDSDSMLHVFHDVRHIIVSKNLKGGGFTN